MNLKTKDLKRLIESDEPDQVVWDMLWDLWSEPADSLSDHYRREHDAVSFERTLLESYRELYTEVLPWKSVNEASLEVPDDGAFVVMDAMSVREGALFVEQLREQGFDVGVSYSFSSLPSETTPYKNQVGYSDLENQYKTATVVDRTPSLTGDEDIVWSRFPDAMVEKIQEGKTKISSVEEMYEDTESVLMSIIDQLDAERIVVGSDHGYIRHEAGFAFPTTNSQRSQLQNLFGGDRYARIDEVDAEDLVEDGLVVEANGYYLAAARYTWPLRGKYRVVEHGGLSVMECITPRLTAIK